MPLYEYECQACRKKVEMIQRFSDPPYTICPQCGGELKKLISAPAIQFKGSGFYVNDYARGRSTTDNSTTKSSDTKSGDTSSSATKTDS